MALTVTVDDTIARARKRADMETGSESEDNITDDEIVEYINDGYRELYDIIAEYADVEYFGTSATVVSPYALPADFYRALGVDYNNRTLKTFTLRQRNTDFGGEYPRWRVQGGSLKFAPSTFTGSVTLYYVPTADTLASGGSFDSFDGWDVFVVLYTVKQMLRKQEYDTSAVAGDLARAEARVRRAARRIKPDNGVLLDVTTLPDDYYID